MDQSGTFQKRQSHRAPVLLKANLIVNGKAYGVRLRNLSEEGALVQSDEFPPEGIHAFFERKDLRVPSRVIWVQGQFAGIKFGRPLKSEDVLRNVPTPLPPKQLQFKRPGLACRQLTTYERKMVEHWMTNSPVAKPGE